MAQRTEAHHHDCLGPRALAFEQASVYLPSSDAAQLGRSCSALQAFLGHAAHRAGAYWLLQPGAARGSYQDGVAWLHALVEPHSAAAFAEAIRRVKVAGRLEFHSRAVLNACTAALASAGGAVHDFAVAWRFAPSRVTAFLEGTSQEPLLSEALQFECSHGFAFGVSLALSRSRQNPSVLELGLRSIDIIGGSLPQGVEVRASGAVPAVRALGHMQADLLPIRRRTVSGAGEARPHPIRLWLREEQCKDFLRHCQLVSLLSVDVGAASPARGASPMPPVSEERKGWVRPLVA